ncbi:metalloregulator ArsR/SmtB family transcription factor [Marinicella sp. W31]|uniref:metalloregulator ArsR/SmtB family transcription factor n=1 Tax=Marinicella sp. W31 TaxID=3023713 RepID=UPI0037576F81
MDPVQFYKCLADETRLRSLLLIAREHELCVCELTEALNESQPKISRHLAQLRACGLLNDKRQGQWIYYRIHQELPEWAVTVIHQTLNVSAEYLQQNIRNLNNMTERPNRCG